MEFSPNPAVRSFEQESPFARRAIWLIFLLLALALHLVLLRARVPWTDSPAPPPVEVLQVDPKKLDAIRKKWKESDQQLLLDEKQRAQSEAPPDHARYFSDKNIRVEKEQRAKQSDVVPQPEKHSGKRTKPQSRSQPLEGLKSFGIPFNLAKRPPAPDTEPGQNRDQETGTDPGTEKDHQRAAHQRLMDRSLPEGSENLLNAQESVFYSFYSRIYESIGPIWQSDVRASRPERRIEPGDYVTTVDIVLDQQGNLVDVRLLQSSGVQAFDQSVFRSWKRAPRFPNPPRGLLDSSGYVHMGWSFSVQVDQSFGVQYLPPERT